MAARRPEGIDEMSRQLGALQSDIATVMRAIGEFKDEIASARTERNERFDELARQIMSVSDRASKLESLVKTGRTLATGFSAGLLFAVAAVGFAFGIGIDKILTYLQKLRF